MSKKASGSNPIGTLIGLIVVVIIAAVLIMARWWYLLIPIVIIMVGVYISKKYNLLDSQNRRLLIILWAIVLVASAPIYLVGHNQQSAKQAAENRQEAAAESSSANSSKAVAKEKTDRATAKKTAKAKVKKAFDKLVATGKYPEAKTIEVDFIEDTATPKLVALTCSNKLTDAPKAMVDPYYQMAYQVSKSIEAPNGISVSDQAGNILLTDGKSLEESYDNRQATTTDTSNGDSDSDASTTVYVVPGGTRYYHSKTARSIRHSKNVTSMTEAEAKAKGYTQNIRGE